MSDLFAVGAAVRPRVVGTVKVGDLVSSDEWEATYNGLSGDYDHVTPLECRPEEDLPGCYTAYGAVVSTYSYDAVAAIEYTVNFELEFHNYFGGFKNVAPSSLGHREASHSHQGEFRTFVKTNNEKRLDHESVRHSISGEGVWGLPVSGSRAALVDALNDGAITMEATGITQLEGIGVYLIEAGGRLLELSCTGLRWHAVTLQSQPYSQAWNRQLGSSDTCFS